MCKNVGTLIVSMTSQPEIDIMTLFSGHKLDDTWCIYFSGLTMKENFGWEKWAFIVSGDNLRAHKPASLVRWYARTNHSSSALFLLFVQLITNLVYSKLMARVVGIPFHMPLRLQRIMPSSHYLASGL